MRIGPDIPGEVLGEGIRLRKPTVRVQTRSLAAPIARPHRFGHMMPLTQVGRSEDLLDELKGWVLLETPTTDPAAVNRLMDVAEAELARAGATLTRIPGRDGFGDH